MKVTATFRTLLISMAILAPIGYLLVLWPQLPARVPIHFDATGKVNGYGSKYMTLVLAGLPLFSFLIKVVAPRLDPKRKLNADATNYQKLMLSLAIGLSVISCVVLYATAAGRLPANMLELGLCLLFVLMGNYLVTIKPNYFIGVRTPWTLESQTVWTKTHRLTGRLFFWGGLVAAALVLLVPIGKAVWVIIALAVGVAVIAYLYSYLAYQQEAQAATPR